MRPETFAIPTRGKYQGVRQIVRYNWPFYAVAGVALLAGTPLIFLFFSSLIWRAVLLCAIALAGFWLCSSLLVSHYVYDRAPLYKWQWLARLLPARPTAWLNVHAGLDETTAALRRMFPATHSLTLDVYDPRQMSEPSIARARDGAAYAANTTVRASSSALPLAGGAFDCAFVVFAAHELRAAEARAKFFGELRRVLHAGGRVVIVEHLRDWANFAAYGPGFWHFLPADAWRGVAAQTGFVIERELKITPFVSVFLLRKT